MRPHGAEDIAWSGPYLPVGDGPLLLKVGDGVLCIPRRPTVPVIIDEDGETIPRNGPFDEANTGELSGWASDGNYYDKDGHRWTPRGLFWFNMFVGALFVAGVAYMLWRM